VRWNLGSTAAGLRLRKNCSGERRPDAAGRERAHRRVSRAGDSKAELTAALDGAWARRWPRNRHWASTDDGGAPCTRGYSEREGERVGQRAQMREGRWASRARGHGRGRRTRGRGRVHGGEIVGGRLRTIDRWGRRNRERTSARVRGRRRLVWPTGQRERGGERARWLALTGGARLSGIWGAGGWAKWAGLG
jgi:hypothetical protein